MLMRSAWALPQTSAMSTETLVLRTNALPSANSTLETGMRLARQPKPFSLHTSRHLMRLLGKSDDQWRKYLFY